MPLFEFKCSKCDKVLEKLISSYEDAKSEVVVCDDCSRSMVLVEFSRTSDPKFVGTGWYVTDYKD